MDNETLQRLRTEYSGRELDEKTILDDPIQQFEQWFKEAVDIGSPEPNAMALATSGIDFKPSARTVLLKGIANGNFIFFTNYNSRKGKELLWNPYACLLFYWNPLNRQVRIEGRVKKISGTDSDAYFHTRPTGSQLGATVSPQSEVIPDRKFIEEKMRTAEEQYVSKEIPRPMFWGGYQVIPHAIEFWQGRENRLHDRILFTRLENDKWKIERLAP